MAEDDTLPPPADEDPPPSPRQRLAMGLLLLFGGGALGLMGWVMSYGHFLSGVFGLSIMVVGLAGLVAGIVLLVRLARDR